MKTMSLHTRSHVTRLGLLVLGLLVASTAFCQDAVSLILKNNSSSSVDVELIDQYGGNFSATIDAGMGSNQTLKADSAIQINGNPVHTVTSADEGMEITIAN